MSLPGPASPPAYRIETGRMVLRCWSPGDAALAGEAIESSLEHLRPWMPWAAEEPQGLEARLQFLRRTRAAFDLGEDFTYGILDPGESRVLGGCGLHPQAVGGAPGEAGALAIGYWIRADSIGHGLATEAAGALARVELEVLGLDRVEIHCDPANVRSAAVPRKLGFTHEATLARRSSRPDGSPRDTMVWSLLRSRLPGSPASRVGLGAYDAYGRRLL